MLLLAVIVVSLTSVFAQESTPGPSVQGKILQRRWRSLRDCYARELNAQKHKSDSEKSDRKQYVFFKQLSFLRQIVGKRRNFSRSDVSTSQDTDSMAGCGEDLVYCELEEANEDESEQGPPKRTEFISLPPSSVTSLKRTHEQITATEIKLLQDLSKRFAHEPASPKHTKEHEEDEDRLFLMSLLKDVKKVHEDNKLEMKSEMILLIKKWQRTLPSQTPLESFMTNLNMTKV